MKQLKKLICAVLCAILLLSAFGGCSLKKQTSSLAESVPEVSSTVSEPSGPYKIGLLQFEENPWLDQIREAFMGRLEEWAYNEDQVSIDYQNAGGDSVKAGEICSKFVEDETDLIVAISADAAKAAEEKAKQAEIPVLFAAAGDPKELGVENLQAPEGNLTGVQDASSAVRTIELALQIDPDLETLGLLYDPASANAASDVKAIKSFCEENEIAIEESSVHNAGEVPSAALSLLEKVDAIYTPSGGVVAGAASAISEAVVKAKKPWYAGTDYLAQGGALAAVSVDYAELGRKAADMAIELMAGKSVSQVPVAVFDTFGTYLNQTTLDALGLQIPDEILENAMFFADASAQ